ncbi:MAG: heparinase II/III family protein, partial [Lentisphaeria bacterium]|nr:heparinase II/III family protein [Lentisphaeria bacterium]
IYPSNDYQAFIDSGYKDRTLITGDHPDDGFGWQSPDQKQKYWFVAWYNKSMVSRRLLPAITDLSEAYLYTDDQKFAHKCAVLLWQLATYYPDYDYVNQSRYGIEIDRSYYGKLQYYTWECFTVDVCARAYDAISPAFAQSLPELEAFTGSTVAQVRHLVEEQLLRAMAREIVNETHVIGGNYGMHQKGLLEIAATLADAPGEPSSEDMLDWVLHNKEYKLYIYMPLYDALYNLVYRDGTPFESPGYNLHWVEDLSIIAELLHLNGVDIFSNPRFRKLYDWPIQMVCAGGFTPSLGDSGNMSNCGKLFREDPYLTAFRAYRDPAYAKVLLSLSPDGGKDIWGKPLGEEIHQKAATLDHDLGYQSQHMAGYGLATLQNNNPEKPFGLAFFYGRFVGHSKRDKMHLDIFAENCSMTPAFGYPETANSNDPRRAGFFWNTVSHNTVIVDERMQDEGRGRCLAYDPGPVCQYVEARNDGVYKQCSEYRRSVAAIEAAPGRSYIIDIFRVQGGKQHDWLVHGSHADLSSDLSFGATRKKGTLAGAEVPYGHFYDDEKLGAAAYGTVGYFGYRGSGYQFLTNVRSAVLKPGAHVKWDFITSGPRAVDYMKGNPGAFLKAHLVGNAERIIACDGAPQQNQKGSSKTVPFIVRRRTGEDLASTFTTVFEPGAHDTFIASIERLPTERDELVALKISLNDGTTHYYFNAPQPVPQTTVDGVMFTGKTGFLCVGADDAVQSAYMHNATALGRGDWKLEGKSSTTTTIQACDYRKNTVSLAQPILADDSVNGTTAIIDSGAYGSSFVIKNVENGSQLHFGDQDPIAARATITHVDAANQTLVTPTVMYFAQPGMHVVNEAMESVGKVKSFAGGRLILDRPFAADRFTDTNGDGLIHAYLMEFGPGDTIEIPSSTRMRRTSSE